MAKIGVDIEAAAQLLKIGNVVGIPTETVYGLAANALDIDAVLSIFEIKQRPTFDPLIIHIANIERLPTWIKELPDEAQKLSAKFWPGPLTLLLPKKNIIPDLVTSGLENVAIRIPSHSMTLSLLQKLDFPLAAPSANPFGYISPTTAEHVNQQLGEKIPYILDGGSCQIGLESTIIGWENKKAIVYRLGGLEVDEIEKTLGYHPEIRKSSSKPAAPGMLESHYAPKHPLFLGNIDELIKENPLKNAGILSFNSEKTYSGLLQKILTHNNNCKEASKNLFMFLREMDSWDIDCIFAERAPEYGLGLAINDRLIRASVNIKG